MNIQRSPRTPYIKGVRPMVRADIESLRQPSARPRLQNIRDVHHIIARLIVSGLTLREIAEEVGYSVTRISIIKTSPAMEELVARYRGDVTESWKRSNDAVYDNILRAEAMSWRKIVDRLEEDEENNEIPLVTLLKIADSGSDRTGHHRKSTKENININFAANLEAAIQRSAKVIDHE
jgi:lambda repressor-like predicted transcriptional regulator